MLPSPLLLKLGFLMSSADHKKSRHGRAFSPSWRLCPGLAGLGPHPAPSCPHSAPGHLPAARPLALAQRAYSLLRLSSPSSCESLISPVRSPPSGTPRGQPLQLHRPLQPLLPLILPLFIVSTIQLGILFLIISHLSLASLGLDCMID